MREHPAEATADLLNGKDTTQRTRYEVPAVIVVDALDAEDAATRARNLAGTLAETEGPGAFFHEIGLAAVGAPIKIGDFPGEKPRLQMSVGAHAASLRPSPEAGAMSTSDGLGGDPVDRRSDGEILDEIAKVLRTVDSWTDPECGDLIAEKVKESGREPDRDSVSA